MCSPQTPREIQKEERDDYYRDLLAVQTRVGARGGEGAERESLSDDESQEEVETVEG